MIDFDVITEGEVLTVIRRISPCRLAFFVPDQVIEKAVHFVLWNSILWGGAHNMAIPYSSTGRLTEEWKKIMEFFHPDQLINLVGTDHEVLSTLERVYGILPSELRSRPDCVTMQGLTVAMRRLGKPFHLNPVFDCCKERNKRYYLPVIATTGLLGESIVGTLLQSDSLRELSYIQLLGTELKDSETDLDSVEAYLEISKRVYDTQYNASTNMPFTFVKGLTSRYLKYNLHRSSIGPLPDCLGDHILWNAYTTKFLVVVVGDTTSVPDLCVYWDLLSVYQSRGVSVFWIRNEHLADEKTAQSLLHYANYPSKIYVTSASLDENDIDLTVLRKTSESASVQYRRISEFFTPGFSVTSESSTVISSVHERRINVVYPTNELIQKLPTAYQYRVEFDVKLNSVQSYRLPHTTLLRRNLRPEGFVKMVRRGMPATSNVFSERFPERWAIMQVIFDTGRLAVKPSNQGLKVMGILNLFDKPQELAILSMETFNNLVELFNKPGTFLSWYKMHNELRGNGSYSIDRNFTNDLLIWLVKHKILARYFPVQCPLCHTNQFVAVGDIAEITRCEGCFEEILTPLGKEVCYGMNKRFCSEVRDQGGLLPLLTLGYLTGYRDRSALAFYPGIDVDLESSVLGKRFNKESKELDLVYISPNTNLTLGECKWCLGRLKDEEIDIYCALGKVLNAELLVSTMSELTEAKEQVSRIKRRGEKNGSIIEIIGKEDLLNFSYSYSARQLREPPPVEEKRKQHIGLIERLIKSDTMGM